MNRTKLGIITLVLLFIVVGVSRLITGGSVPTPGVLGINFSNRFTFEFNKTRNDTELERIISTKVRGTEGDFAVYIETIATASANPKQKYALNELEPFPAASLYKLILLAAVLKEVESGSLSYEDKVTSTKSHLADVLGGVDFGYEEAPENIKYSVDEALTRVGRISDNFAAIMLSEKLRSTTGGKGTTGTTGLNPRDPRDTRDTSTPRDTFSKDPLVQMAKDLGMNNTSFDSDPIKTTASDIAVFFKALYEGRVVSPEVSEKIVGYLSLSQLNNRIPAGVPEGVRVVHKTGELSRIRHDAGIVFPPNNPDHPENPYIIVLLSKDLKYEDAGIKVLAEISKEVYNYFSQKE